ncbi:hypothetical protein VCUG_01113 [Vavraia culicis subsp. floridensis]|uniref:Uncharacterized protein n=1 Tax=Vavraia culicis (isolate floridensis) TaxID=948595 RepID=L2GUP0_VAVCU|nr:uncharacterized protein VCUG_01113 [Vavraia culicis subsp. floridensis]ELA47344.1 hypothetical protein VCUG_01113 [Vavraia culicis subsp. floridensis]
MSIKEKGNGRTMYRLLSTYRLPYGHLVHNNSNYWLKTTRMTVYEYPNLKVKKHKQEKPLKLFTKEDNDIYYQNSLIINADAVDEESFLAYRFIKKSDEILLEEYKFYIADYFLNLEIFGSLRVYNSKIDELVLKDSCKMDESLLVRRKQSILLVYGKYEEEKNADDTLDFTGKVEDDTYFYNYKNKVIMYNTPALKIKTSKKIMIYNSETKPIIDIGNFLVYKSTTCIQNCTFADYYKNLYLLVNGEGIFLIYKNLIIFKREKNVVGGNIKTMSYYHTEKRVIKKTLYDLFFLLSLFYEYVFIDKNDSSYLELFGSKALRSIPIHKLEKTIVSLMLSNYHKFIESFLSDLFTLNTFDAESFYANLFRQLDDANREYLKKFNFIVKYAANFYKLVLYFPQEVDNFVKMAITQGKEYYVTELINYYKTQKYHHKLSILRFCLLDNNCFYLYNECLDERSQALDQIKELMEAEQANIKTQFRRDFYYVDF